MPMALALVLGNLPAAASAVESGAAASFVTDHLVNIVEATSDAGFIHPGIGVTADNLRNARKQVRAGVEPWASFYAGMVASPQANRTFAADNASGTVDVPASDAFDSLTMRGRITNDSMRAMTQAFMYYITGDDVYRANAIKMLRLWSNLDPNKYAYFADAHIHTGHSLYQMLMAAEIIRYTDTDAAAYDGYSIVWSALDTEKLENNLAKPVLSTFLYSNERFQNQHNFGTIGAIAAGIFMDDAALYAQRVEWFTVNQAFVSERNGSLASLFPLIAADDPLNPYGRSYVQHNEMGRDQAHAEGDVTNFTVMARIVNNQGTKLDPTAGTVSTAANAVSPYAFLGNRILAGGNAFYSFMMGDEVPWIDTTGGPGIIAQAYRGRVFNWTDELYNQYKYVAGVDVDTVAPGIKKLHDRWDGTNFFNGTANSSYWFAGDWNQEYWLAFPAELAGTPAPSAPTDPTLSFASRGTVLGGHASVATQDGESFIRVDTGADGSTVAMDRLVYDDRTGYSPIGVRVRTDGPASLGISKVVDGKPYATVTLPDTHGKWRYVTYDLNQSVVSLTAVGSNLAFFRVSGATGTTVDLDRVNLQARSQD